MTASPSGQLNSRIAIDTLIWLTEQAFSGDPAHSLMANLQGLSDEEWVALPAGAGRSVADILEHVGWAKWMYEDYAFGAASLRGDQPPLAHDLYHAGEINHLRALMRGDDRWPYE